MGRKQKPFWYYVDVDGENACWEFIGGHMSKGYGEYYFDGKMILAHRLAWILTFGEIQDGLCVLHSCDNPPCCNPEHLFLGTYGDNNSDKEKKGRANHSSGDKIRGGQNRELFSGEKNGKHKLTDEKAAMIIALLHNGFPQAKIADIFGVAPTTIEAIALNITWKHIPR